MQNKLPLHFCIVYIRFPEFLNAPSPINHSEISDATTSNRLWGEHCHLCLVNDVNSEGVVTISLCSSKPTHPSRYVLVNDSSTGMLFEEPRDIITPSPKAAFSNHPQGKHNHLNFTHVIRLKVLPFTRDAEQRALIKSSLIGFETPGNIVMNDITSAPLSVSEEEFAKILRLRQAYREGKRFNLKGASDKQVQQSSRDDDNDELENAKMIGQAWFEQIDVHNENVDLEILEEFIFEGELVELAVDDWMFNEYEEDESLFSIVSNLTSPTVHVPAHETDQTAKT